MGAVPAMIICAAWLVSRQSKAGETSEERGLRDGGRFAAGCYLFLNDRKVNTLAARGQASRSS